MNYDIDFIKEILLMNLSDFQNLISFVLDFSQLSEKNRCEKKLSKRNLYKQKRQLLKKYSYKLKNIDLNFILNDLNEILLSNKSIGEFLKLMKYIMLNYHDRIKMLNCLNSLEQLGINEIEFGSLEDLRVYCKNTETYGVHSICDAYSDGVINIIYDSSDEGILFFDKASYVLSYSKNNIDGLTDLKAYVENLQFDVTTLPSYNKLHDKRVMPGVSR